MSKPYKIPDVIINTCERLNELVEQHPIYIPLPVVAEFLGMNAEGLRYSIEQGICPFGIAWQKSIGGYKAFKIPTVTFYFWIMNMRGLPPINAVR